MRNILLITMLFICFFGNDVSSIAITANASNTCGVSPNQAFYLTKKTSGCPASFTVIALPNPATDELTVETVSLKTEFDILPGIDAAILLNGQGEVQAKGQLKNDKMKINVKGLKKGLYFLHATVQGETFKEQITIE